MSPRNLERESLLPRFSLERRVTVLVLLASILVVGAVATLGIPLELIPRGFSSPFLRVWATWSDAPGQEVLDKVTLPLEEELSTVSGLERIWSFSTTGFGQVGMTFKSRTDMDVAYREVRDRVERAKARMPDDLDRVMIHKDDGSGVPVYMFGVTVDPEVTDPYNLIQNEIILPIQRIDGVANVENHGLEEKEILIELDREKAEAAGLNIWQLGQELAGDNFTLASGTVYSGGRKLLLRSVAKYHSREELENRLVAPSVRLGDVAEVEYDLPESNYRARAMSRPAIAVLVFKEGDANTLEVADRIDAVVQSMKDNPRLEQIGTATFFNQAAVIRDSLSTLVDSGKIGAVFALVVLFFFLRRFRMTLIVTLSIPLSMLIGLTAMYFFGETLNVISLLGLMISVGLLVDNSVVVAENIFRLHRDGVPRREACIRGAGEISLAIIMATLTTIIVFLPVALVEGQGQFFLLRLALPISASLIASLLVALVFIPLSVYLTLPPSRGAARRHENALAARLQRRIQSALRWLYDATLGRLNHGYTRLLALFLNRRLDLFIGIALAAVVTSAVVFDAERPRAVQIVDVQDEDRGGFEVDVQLPQSTTLEDAEKYFRSVEKVLEAKKDDYGLEGYFIFHRATYGEIQGWFKSPKPEGISPRAVVEAFLEEMPEKAGARVYTGDRRNNQEEKAQNFVARLYGDDAAQLEEVAESLEEVFLEVDGVLGVQRAAERPADELGLVVDRDRSQRLGINPEVVAGVVGYALRGRALPKFYADGKEIPVRVRFEEEDRESLDLLADFQVPTGDGESVSLASVTRAHRLPVANRIFRRDKQVSRSISLELEEGREEETRQRLNALMANIDLPEGVRFGEPPQTGAQSEDTKNLLFAAGLSIIFIYLLMGFLFESFILPLSILPTIPLAFLGVGWIHYFFGYDIDGLGMVGLVLLIGVVVNNGIVLIDYVNRLRGDGLSRREAVLTATDRRFRPIMMTALTTICGMVPLTAGGTSSLGISYKSFGLTLIGGMTTATVLTLLVVPVVYTLLDDLRRIVAAVLGRAARRRPAAETAG
ncbi:MAG: efflux RND transporter permease subunit [Acidobacteria bacterium]|nr:MAG: efflux RND transporter permease subunit [Acidobacteriota bacterium]